jgi:hypothetical protein
MNGSPDPKTRALVADMLAELKWLHEHQDWGDFPTLIGQRFKHYAGLGLRLREEDLRQFPADLMLTAGISDDPQVLGFFTVVLQLVYGLGMVGSWATMAEQLAAGAVKNLIPDGST